MHSACQVFRHHGAPYVLCQPLLTSSISNLIMLVNRLFPLKGAFFPLLPPGCRHCAAAEGRVLSGEQRIAELAGEVAALQEQLGGAMGALQEARAEGGALRDELGALGEDMQALVRENQVGGGFLARVCICVF